MSRAKALATFPSFRIAKGVECLGRSLPPGDATFRCALLRAHANRKKCSPMFDFIVNIENLATIIGRSSEPHQYSCRIDTVASGYRGKRIGGSACRRVGVGREVLAVLTGRVTRHRRVGECKRGVPPSSCVGKASWLYLRT